jgi:hypothetical protein
VLRRHVTFNAGPLTVVEPSGVAEAERTWIADHLWSE